MGEKLLSPASLEEHLQQIGARATLVPVEVETPTVDAAAQAVGTAPENIVKSLIFIAAGEAILVIAAGTKRVQVEKLAIELGIEEQKIRLAKPDEVLKQTGYPVGGVPPFGHQNPIRAYMQADLLTADEVYAGGGAADHLLRVSPQEILRLSAASVIQLQQEA